MRKITIILLLALIGLWVSCGGKHKDMAYYEAQIDSIRKAEQLRQIKHDAGLSDDPVEVFYDTLRLTPLPIQSAGGNIDKLGLFTKLPPSVTASLDYPMDTPLRMLLLPRYKDFGVVILAEDRDSVAPFMTLLTMDHNWQPIDELTLYEENGAERGDYYVTTFNDYFIDNQYHITVMDYYRKDHDDKPHLESTHRYQIDAEGRFEELIENGD